MPVNPSTAVRVDGWFSRLGRVLLPTHCLVCLEAGVDGHDLCVDCQRALPWNHSACARCGLPMPEPVAACGRCLKKPPPLDRVYAAFDYGFPVDRLLPRFKFHHDLAAGRELAEAMHAMLVEAMPVAASDRPQALVAVPLHSKRLRERGYNQALELAKPLSKAFAIPLLRDGLRRIRDIAPQSGLGALARRRNPRGAFAVGGDVIPVHVALVDDVMTTGATLYECARVLRRAGVQRVDAWVAARVPSR
ncbi:MAG TPA: ComF family protein [Xanthomonadaceae bacterium]|nr:ComF family protein [Xanthomonadaceae bacterium]